jgi:hypothetical protein
VEDKTNLNFMKIALINYEQNLGMDAILSKYARMLERELIDLGHDAFITGEPVEADINHHINYISYKPSGGIDTTMITHLTGDLSHSEKEKIKMCKEQSKTAFGICMNKEIMEKLIKNGIPKEKLSYVLHAHDGMERRPRLIAMIYNVYPDGRQREDMFVKLVNSLKDKSDYAFQIMGKGWKPILDSLLKKGLQVNYMDNFYGDLYQQMLMTSDYLLFTGDEDSLAQSIVDATNAGLRVIAPPQNGLKVEYPFSNQQELNQIFKDINSNPVRDWTWENYTKQHETLWNRLK